MQSGNSSEIDKKTKNRTKFCNVRKFAPHVAFLVSFSWVGASYKEAQSSYQRLHVKLIIGVTRRRMRDSFITHRAFCDALAEETARSSSSSLNHLPLHLPINFPLKSEPQHLFQNPQLSFNIGSNSPHPNHQLPSCCMDQLLHHTTPMTSTNVGSTNIHDIFNGMLNSTKQAQASSETVFKLFLVTNTEVSFPICWLDF
ncbi:hypothetical protein CTI12_AA063800 [Artemisia annua]|uniref:BIRD-IDD transcription factor fourth C2HC zinc finger domain-containing protein n=1 Tax=Artemisia annua TaxID=35608 RepID=A0A2U1Q803_ARTAN|nr:hypothetical protein CTI12_AA063800 [Artemisia annua]